MARAPGSRSAIRRMGGQAAPLTPTRRAFMTGLAAAGGSALLPTVAVGKAAPLFLRIGTGSTAGTYFPVGGVIASVISNPPGTRACEEGGNCGVPGVIAAAQATKGSLDNIARLSKGTVDLALTQADIAYWSYFGEGALKDETPNQDFRAIARLYPEALHLAVRASSHIHSIADLKGRRVSAGEVGSGTLIDSELLMESFGVTKDDYVPFYQSPADSADALINETLDAFFLIAGHPARVIDDLSSRVGVRLIPLEGPEVDQLVADFPYFSRTTIPEDVYAGVASTATLSVGALLVARADMEADLAYAITEAIMHDNARAIYAAGHPMAAEISLARALDSVAIPLHPGAARFYDEVGLVAPNLETQ